MRVLLVEDDRDIAAFVRRGLEEDGFAVTPVAAARAGMIAATTEEYDVIVFDRLLPDMDGIDAIRVLREAKLATPILVLTALSRIDDRVQGLEAGADDYLVKPFAYSELKARLDALLRRRPLVERRDTLEAGPLRLDRIARNATRDGVDLALMPREVRILEVLMEHPGQVVTRTMLLEKVWGYRFDPKTSLVQTHLSRLRAKVDKPFGTELIRTVRGAGYVLEA